MLVNREASQTGGAGQLVCVELAFATLTSQAGRRWYLVLLGLCDGIMPQLLLLVRVLMLQRRLLRKGERRGTSSVWRGVVWVVRVVCGRQYTRRYRQMGRRGRQGRATSSLQITLGLVLELIVPEIVVSGGSHTSASGHGE